MTNRPRIRRPRTMRLVFLNASHEDCVCRMVGGRRGWANEARLHDGASEAMRMLALRLARCRVGAIAEMFGTTRSAVYQRL